MFKYYKIEAEYTKNRKSGSKDKFTTYIELEDEVNHHKDINLGNVDTQFFEGVQCEECCMQQNKNTQHRCDYILGSLHTSTQNGKVVDFLKLINDPKEQPISCKFPANGDGNFVGSHLHMKKYDAPSYGEPAKITEFTELSEEFVKKEHVKELIASVCKEFAESSPEQMQIAADFYRIQRDYIKSFNNGFSKKRTDKIETQGLKKTQKTLIDKSPYRVIDYLHEKNTR